MNRVSIFEDVSGLQFHLNRCLLSFLNGSSISRVRSLLAPLRWRFLLQDLARDIISHSAISADTPAWSIWSTIASRPASTVEVATGLSLGYQLLDRQLSSLPAPERRIAFPSAYHLGACVQGLGHTHWATSALSAAVREKQNEIGAIGFWVHGSFGSRDPIPGYSDLDCLFLINRQTCTSSARLLEAQATLTRIQSFLSLTDPLQHHGFFFISEVDLRFYPEAFFPLELLRWASPNLLGELPHPIALRNDKPERRSFFDSGMKTILSYPLETIRSSAYHTKAFLQTAVLMPALYLQVRDARYHYKRDTFSVARPTFSSFEWLCIDEASRIRNSWRYESLLPRWFRLHVGLGIHGKALAAVDRLESRLRPNSLFASLDGKFVDSALSLVKKMDSNLKELGL
jgi:hypothetical protein